MAIILEQPMLFKRAKTGKIQSYRILTKHGKAPGEAVIVKQTGQLEGKKIEHQESITKGKNIDRANETTTVQQAIFQMQSDWQKKKDEGYKDLAELGYPNPLFSVTAVMSKDHIRPLADFLQDNLPQFNTDASGNMKPMLAYPIEKVKESSIEFPVFVQPKLDGVRCLAIISTSEVKLLSRGGKYYKVPHIQKELKKFRDFLTTPEDVIILDGEIYNHEMEFEDIVSSVKAIKASTMKLKYCIYDRAESDDIDFQHRFEGLSALFSEDIDKNIITLVPTKTVQSMDQISKFHNRCIESGYEGAMVRLRKGRYGFGARSRSLLKVKKFDETEYPLIKFTADGHRGIQDLKAIVKTEGGKAEVSMNGTISHKASIMADWEAGNIPVGTLITVEHFGLTNGNQPRFPKGKCIRDYD